MPTNAPILITFAGLPGGSDYCMTGLSRFALDIAAGLSGYVPGAYSFFNYGAGPIAVDDRDKPWFNTNDRQWYFWDGSDWSRPHPVPASSNSRMLWVGTEVSLETYDGGAAGVVGTSTGPMWEVDHSVDAKFPLFPGTLPSTSVVVVGATGGSETKTLDLTNLPPHHHTMDLEQDGTPGSVVWSTKTGGTASPVFPDGAVTKDAGGTGGVATPVNLLPPYVGIFLIKRTARVNYVA